MYCLGETRRDTRSPRAIRSRSRWRIFSRSSATDFIRLPRLSPAKSGIASVMTVAMAAMAANTAAIILGSCSFSIRNSTTTCDLQSVRTRILRRESSEIEIDHLLHHHHADQHPAGGASHQETSGRMRPQQLDVVRARDVDEQHHAEWERRDDGGGSLGFHRHRLDLRLHFLAVAQHARQVCERLGEVAAGALLNRDHDAEE